MQQQQPANMSGTPVIVSVQTAPIQTRRRYIPVTSKHAQEFKLLGVSLVVIGVLCITFQIISFGCMPDIAAISGNAIWLGTQFIVVGVFGIFAGRTGRKCQVITFHVLSTISAVFAFILFCIAAVSAWLSSPYPGHYVAMVPSIVATVIEALVAMLGIAGGVVAIRSSVIGCTIGACCCKCRGSCCCPTDSQYQQLHNLDQPDLTQEQSLTSGQQEPTFNTNQEQSVLNQHQQQLMFNSSQQQLMLNPSQKQLVLNPNHQPPLFNPNQQQPMFNPNQQQPMFNPNQQQPMFNPNQQQPMFNPNQQQPMFNPNQEQPMFNPNQQQLVFLSTQPNVGFYPQHQAVQYYALQPTTVPDSHQTDASTILSGATGQGQDTGPLTELKATPLPDDNTGISRGNGSDKDPISSDDVEMLSP